MQKGDRQVVEKTETETGGERHRVRWNMVCDTTPDTQVSSLLCIDSLVAEVL